MEKNPVKKSFAAIAEKMDAAPLAKRIAKLKPVA